MASDCSHDRVTDSRCELCGACVHEVILNGVCYHCGESDPKVTVIPAADVVPVERLKKDR